MTSGEDPFESGQPFQFGAALQGEKQMSEENKSKADGGSSKGEYALGGFVGGIVAAVLLFFTIGTAMEAIECKKKSDELSKRVDRFDDRVESLHSFYMKERDEYQGGMQRLKRLEQFVNEAMKDEGE